MLGLVLFTLSSFTPSPGFYFVRKLIAMARITVEDCMKNIPNRFQLTLAATYRARQLAQGGTPMLEANRDKPTVIALREMAAGLYGVEYLNRVNSA